MVGLQIWGKHPSQRSPKGKMQRWLRCIHCKIGVPLHKIREPKKNENLYWTSLLYRMNQ
jgi:hypothetical protein